MRATLLPAIAGLSAFAQAHFVLNYPTTLGFDDETEPEGPCGGVDIKFGDNDTAVQVGGFAVAITSTHPASEFLYRATVSKSAPYNWTNLLPVISETGLGSICLPSLSAPAEFAGQQGLVQVIGNGPDGILYQCAAVNFESGTNSTIGSNCKNGTITATVTDEQTFANATVSDNSSSTSTSSSSSSASGSTGAAGSSSTSQAAAAAALATPFAQAVLAGVGLMAFM